MSTYLKRTKEFEEKYKTELSNARKKLQEIEQKISNEVDQLEKIEEEEKLKYLLLKCKEIEELGGIKTVGITIQEAFNAFFSSGNCVNQAFLHPEVSGSTFVVRWYLKIKELYPSYDIFTDVVEGKREYFNQH